MAQTTLDGTAAGVRCAAIPIRIGDPAIHHLTPILTALLDDPRSPSLPAWTYRTWCLALQYRELNPQAQAPMKELGRRRDEALSHPTVRLLVEWAGSRQAG